MEFLYEYEYGAEETKVLQQLTYGQLKSDQKNKKALRSLRFAHCLLGAGYIFLAISFYFSSDSETKNFCLAVFLLLGGLWIFIGFTTTGFLWNYSAKKTAASLHLIKEKGQALLNDQGVFLSAPYTEIHQFWDGITEWGKSGSFVYIICGNFILLIDQNKITAQEYQTLQRLLEDHISLSGVV